MSKNREWPRGGWGLIASLAYIAGAAISFATASVRLEKGTTPDELISLLTIYLVIGLFLGGIGQLMRSAAHGATSSGGKLVDGVGKAVGLLGWSFALVGAVMFALEGTESPDWLLNLAVLAVLIPTALTLLVSILRWRVPK